MKFTRVLALALAAVCVLLTFASCGNVTAPKINVTVKIIGDDPEEPILDTVVEVQDAAPTVLMAFREACELNEIAYDLTEGEDSVLNVKDFKDYTEKETGIAHYWMYYINDVEPTSGKANVNAIADGDVITYMYVTFDPATAK